MTKRPSLASNMRALSEQTAPDPAILVAQTRSSSDTAVPAEGKKFHARTRAGMKRLLIPIEPGLHKKLKLLAVQQDITLEALARTALADYLASHN